MFSLSFTTNSAAFDGDERYMESGRILADVASRVADGQTSGACRDSNGNRVGEWVLTRPA